MLPSEEVTDGAGVTVGVGVAVGVGAGVGVGVEAGVAAGVGVGVGVGVAVGVGVGVGVEAGVVASVGMGVGVGVAVGVGVGTAVGVGVDVDTGIGVGVGVGVTVGVGGLGVAVSAGAEIAPDADTGAAMSEEATLYGASSFGVSSIVKPKPMKLAISARVDMPANLRCFLADFFLISFTNAISINTGRHIRHRRNNSIKTLFIIIFPLVKN